MFPSEMVILMAIAATGDSGKKFLTRPMDITGEYVGYLYTSLVRRGYLQGNRARGYKLTPSGRETLSGFLQANKTRVKDTLNTLQLLGIEISQDNPAKEVVEIK